MSIVEGVLFRLPIALNSMGLVETRLIWCRCWRESRWKVAGGRSPENA